MEPHIISRLPLAWRNVCVRLTGSNNRYPMLSSFSSQAFHSYSRLVNLNVSCLSRHHITYNYNSSSNHYLQQWSLRVPSRLYSATTTTPSISTTSTKKPKKKESISFVDKIREWFNIEKKPPKSLLRASGYLWYVKIADEINFDAFYKICNLPDTFTSWFMVVELHVWLLSTRLMEEPTTGKIVRNSMIRAMWEDIDVRSKKLEGALAAARRAQIKELNEQFQATLLGYDEGLLSRNDTVMAGALWRKFLRNATALQQEEQSTSTTTGHTKSLLGEVMALELLVLYVRSEHYELQQLSREQILLKRDYKWKTFNQNLIELKRYQS